DVNGLLVEGIKLDALLVDPQPDHEVLDLLELGVGNGQAEPKARGEELFSLQDRAINIVRAFQARGPGKAVDHGFQAVVLRCGLKPKNPVGREESREGFHRERQSSFLKVAYSPT